MSFLELDALIEKCEESPLNLPHPRQEKSIIYPALKEILGDIKDHGLKLLLLDDSKPVGFLRPLEENRDSKEEFFYISAVELENRYNEILAELPGEDVKYAIYSDDELKAILTSPEKRVKELRSQLGNILSALEISKEEVKRVRIDPEKHETECAEFIKSLKARGAEPPKSNDDDELNKVLKLLESASQRPKFQ